MADIRQSTSFLDDFNRANENPLASPWVARFSGSGRGRLLTNRLISSTTSTWIDSWTTESFDGDEAEAWASTWGTLDQNEFWYMGLLQNLNGTNVLDGYDVRLLNQLGVGPRWQIHRWDNQVQTQLGANVDGGGLAENDKMLLRREGADVVAYSTTDAVTWTERIRRTDSTYTTGLYLGLGVGSIDATGPGWDDFGGGPGEDFMPQIYRRVFG